MTHTSAAVASIPWRTLLVSSVLIAGALGVSHHLRHLDFKSDRGRTPPAVRRDDASHLLDQALALVRERSSYAALSGIDLAPDFERADAALPGAIERAEFVRLLRRLLAPIGDAHLDVDDENAGAAPSAAFTTFLLAALDVPSGSGVVAIQPDRSSLTNPQAPYVVTVNDHPIETLISRASAFVSAGSPQLVRERAVRELREIARFAGTPDEPAPTSIAVGFAPSPQDPPSVVRSLPLSPRKQIYGEWPRTRSRLIDRADGAIGYLRIARMDDDARFLAALHDSMREFRHTRALIIDVRGNSGGSRDALHAILPYLMPPGSSPIVYNLARPRRTTAAEGPGLSTDAIRSLERRGLLEINDPRRTAPQREAIELAMRGFTPARAIPDERFAPWRLAVVSPPGTNVADGSTREPATRPLGTEEPFADVGTAEFHFDRPVYVLMDSVCFSATDVFLSAIRLIPRVTLVGLSSAGGSGASVRHDITDRDGEPSGFSLRLSSMASFQADGTPLDGVGVAPDIHRPYLPGDLVFGEDSMLAFTLDLVDRNHAQTAEQRVGDRGDE